ncbi:hypothetical protein BFS30_16245 [Pedobacter steynii]|uniref:Response regulatory domain-containing protein n=2 Tax=Pedobacter steynii TaxID=430522 RepID=A0A1D7QIU5_9SPHI|nr:response regulator [Pedobacter steynii]AOM78594.1 hypothetical protein BFS30_16245 [Pedobacter steynii]
MGKQTGFDVLKLLPRRNFEVIFVTTYDQYGIQAVKFAALAYLLKPIDIEELIVKSWLKEDGGMLLLMSGEKVPISKPNKDTVKQALQQL